MGCFSPKTKFKLPDYVKKPSQAISAKVTGLMDKEFVPYEGDMTAGMTGTQTDAMAQLKALLGGGLSAPRLIDNVPGASGGPAGSTQDYMDPYLSGVLEPILRNINTSRMQSNMDLDAAANMSGAFGDKGTAVARAETNERAMQAAGDATGKAYSDAYNAAMGLKSADINRMMDSKGQEANILQQLFGMGTQEQGTDQAELDAKLAEFLRGEGFDIDLLQKLSSIVGGLPTGTATTSPSTASSILGGAASIGSIIAAL